METSLKIWQVIVGIGTLASIAAWLFELFKGNYTWKEFIYPSLAILFAATSGYLAFQNQQLSSFKLQAKELAVSWPASTYDGSFHEGTAKGIVIRGFQFLETNRNLYPKVYESQLAKLEKMDLSDSLAVTREADAMITIIRGIAGEKVELH